MSPHGAQRWVAAYQISRGLLGTAKGLSDGGGFGPALAVIAAQMAFEVYTENAFAALFSITELDPNMQQAVVQVLPEKTFQDRGGGTHKLWTALTGDELKKCEHWKEYRHHVERRNALVHARYEADVEINVDEGYADIVRFQVEEERGSKKVLLDMDQEQSERSISAVRGLIDHMHGIVKSYLEAQAPERLIESDTDA